MGDQATSNKNNATNQGNPNNRATSGSESPVKKKPLQVVPATDIAPKQKDTDSPSLNNFRETLKDILEEITSLEVNTLIVSNIEIARFEAKEFYTTVMQNAEEGLQDIKKSLLERSSKLRQKGSAVSQAELDSYNRDLGIYQKAERKFTEGKNSPDPQENKVYACYEDLAQKLLNLNIPKDDYGAVIPDARMIRYFRKLWEVEQSVLHGERVYAQTKFQLDGDLSNRFLEDLFVPISGKGKIDPKMSGLVLNLHNQAVENSQKQWMGLITTCVNLVKELIPYRK